MCLLRHGTKLVMQCCAYGCIDACFAALALVARQADLVKELVQRINHVGQFVGEQRLSLWVVHISRCTGSVEGVGVGVGVAGSRGSRKERETDEA